MDPRLVDVSKSLMGPIGDERECGACHDRFASWSLLRRLVECQEDSKRLQDHISQLTRSRQEDRKDDVRKLQKEKKECDKGFGECTAEKGLIAWWYERLHGENSALLQKVNTLEAEIDSLKHDNENLARSLEADKEKNQSDKDYNTAWQFYVLSKNQIEQSSGEVKLMMNQALND
nr:PREDICTED: uncharacterized protein LOC108952537 [Musa acuminata subsp. malaccensis]XP_018680158.1 PREDICTED: uncharacterized protein LOC108952537 [Musa acuminata subsp. malaccensis]